MFQAASSFTWLDHNEQDRQKMLDLISLFSEKESRDELGIGSVRDALSDLLFPGTSTIQTRARYFLFVPYIYRELERRGVRSAQINDYARREEVRLINALLADENADKEGVIGKRSRKHLQRLPSSVYWAGIGQWGIFLPTKSQAQYHDHLDHFYHIQQQRDEYTPQPRNWHANLPPLPEGFPEGVTFALSADESDYLRERIASSAPQSLLAYLTSCNVTDLENVPFAWQFPNWHDLSDLHKRQLTHARLFSEAIYGAALLYNLILAEMTQSDELIEKYQEWIDNWHTAISLSEIRNWDRDDFWQMVCESNPRLPQHTRQFCDQWIDLLAENSHPSPVAVGEGTGGFSAEARALIKQREYQRKRNKARLHNTRARERWSGASGINQLDYRWNQTKRILQDILSPLATSN